MRKLIMAGVVAVLAGCASPFAGYDLPPGSPRDAVVARMGPPQRVLPLPTGGQRLQYSLQPVGQHAWNVDLDAGGRVVQSRQVLTEANFHRIEAGRWTRNDVEREFGRPAWIDSVASWRGPVMTYRWRDTANSDMFYYVYLDERNVVQRAHPGMEFFNAPNDRN